MRNLESIFDGAERSAPNPFREDVFASGITPLPGVTEMHGEAMTRCIRAFESLLSEKQSSNFAAWGGSGRVILLAAPRAGYGKSHLVGRVRAVTESLIAPVSLPFDPARKVGWETMLVSILNQYRSARCPQAPGCSLFEETARYFQSQTVRMALERGVIAENEVPESEIALRLQFREVFDPKDSNRLVPWLTKKAPQIMDAVGGPLGKRWRIEFDDLVFWNRFFQDASRPKTTAFEQLNELVGASARDRLTQFLRIAADCRPIAFIADHLDGFFGSENAGMQIAQILTELRFAVPRSVTLLCLNEDVWESIFEGRIPTAWIDRLTGEAAPLGEITLDEAEHLLTRRLSDQGWEEGEIDAWMHRNREACFGGNNEDLYPREILRRAAREWDREAAIERRTSSPDSTFPQKATSTSAPEIPHPAPLSPSEEKPKPKTNVFSTAPEPTTPLSPESVPAPAESEPSRERPSTSPISSSNDEPKKPILPQPAPPRKETSAPQERRAPREHIDDASAAARAAGFDLSRGLTNIEAIIADIRGGGGQALSETQSPSGPKVPPRQQMPFSPPASTEGENSPPRRNETPTNGGGGMPPRVSGGDPVGAKPANPFWASDINGRFRELESEFRHKPQLAWQPYSVRRVIQLVGSEFSAVYQGEESVGERPCLTWRVRGSLVAMGFESPENFSYWSAVLNRVSQSGAGSKIVLFSHASAPFDYDAIAAMGASDETAMRHVDVIRMNHGDVAILYAADQLIQEATSQGRRDEAIKAVARQLDPFWRRIGRPLGTSSAEAAN